MFWAIVFVIGLVVVIGLWFLATYNTLVRLRNTVKNGWAQISVQLKRRHDLIPNLVEVVKDYMSYEQETLQKVIQARSAAMQATTPAAASRAEGELSGALSRLFALFERYPDLKANQNVAQLQEELTSTENRIAFARQFYNDSVMRLNNYMQMVPYNIVASVGGFKAEEFFEVPAEEAVVPKVDLR